MKLLSLGAAIGAAIAYFFDSQNGKRRRSITRDRVSTLEDSGQFVTGPAGRR